MTLFPLNDKFDKCHTVLMLMQSKSLQNIKTFATDGTASDSQNLPENTFTQPESIPMSKDEKPQFIMSVRQFFPVSGRGICICGKIFSGALELGQPVWVVGNGQKISSTVVAIDQFGKNVGSAQAGQNVNVLLRTAPMLDKISVGMVAVTDAGLNTCKRFKADVTLLEPEDEEDSPDLFTIHNRLKTRLIFWEFHSIEGLITDMRSSSSGAPPLETALPGQRFQATVELPTDIVLIKGIEFGMARGNMGIASCIVSEVLP